MSRVSASGAAIPAPRSRVADRRPQPVGRRPQLGPVVHRQRGDPRRPDPPVTSAATAPKPDAARRPRLRRRPDRMRHRILAPQQVAREDLAIGAIAVAAVAPQPLLAPPGVLRRQPVPGQPRVGVVHRMEVVVEEQDRQRPAVLDDHAARRRPLVRLMLEEGADAQDRERQPAAEEILPDRHRPHQRQPQHHRHHARQMQRPGLGHRPVAGPQPPRGRRARARTSRGTARSPSARAACCSRRAAAAPAGAAATQTAGSR